MRNKEVEEAIYQLIVDINFASTGCSTGIINVNDIETVLDYISELEEDNIHWRGKYHLLSRKIDVTPNEVIRDKIKELEVISENYRLQEEALLMEITKDKINMLNKILEKGE